MCLKNIRLLLWLFHLLFQVNLICFNMHIWLRYNHITRKVISKRYFFRIVKQRWNKLKNENDQEDISRLFIFAMLQNSIQKEDKFSGIFYFGIRLTCIQYSIRIIIVLRSMSGKPEKNNATRNSSVKTITDRMNQRKIPIICYQNNQPNDFDGFPGVWYRIYLKNRRKREICVGCMKKHKRKDE